MPKSAMLYRKVTPHHICPFGLKSRWLLRKQGYQVNDHVFVSNAEADTFMQEQGVDTTPQTFIDGKRIGGYGDLLRFFGETDPQRASGTTYQPVIAVFATALLMALALISYEGFALYSMRFLIAFISISMCILAILKLRDLFAFSNQFLGYDLLAQCWVPYAWIYPFAEALAGILMLGQTLLFIAAPIALVIGTIGSISVIKAVYIDKRDLKCACVGGNSNVPLGAISLTENLMMALMGGWML